MIPEELRKRLEEAAEKYADEFAVGDAAIIVDLIHEVAKEGFIAGAEWMFKEAGGETALKEMRQTILGQVKGWMKDEFYNCPIWNEPRSRSYFTVQDLIEHFEADINKLWEGEKCSTQ